VESRIFSVLVEPVAVLQKIPTHEEKENSLLRRVHAYAHLLETIVYHAYVPNLWDTIVRVRYSHW